MTHDAVVIENAHDLALELHGRRRLGVRRGGLACEHEPRDCRRSCDQALHARVGSAGPCATLKVNASVRTSSFRWNWAQARNIAAFGSSASKVTCGPPRIAARSASGAMMYSGICEASSPPTTRLMGCECT